MQGFEGLARGDVAAGMSQLAGELRQHPDKVRTLAGPEFGVGVERLAGAVGKALRSPGPGPGLAVAWARLWVAVGRACARQGGLSLPWTQAAVQAAVGCSLRFLRAHLGAPPDLLRAAAVIVSERGYMLGKDLQDGLLLEAVSHLSPLLNPPAPAMAQAEVGLDRVDEEDGRDLNVSDEAAIPSATSSNTSSQTPLQRSPLFQQRSHPLLCCINLILLFLLPLSLAGHGTLSKAPKKNALADT